ncbi:MAG: type II secretion system inner membrane protein GspF [Deltaproteobacteria bacterium]|nr:type II secretion system inner membrane protein GspF [Deltaproteobacteria bacterium]
MPVFEYKGVDANSKSVSGVIEADSERAARGKLRKQKIFPTKIAPEGAGSGLKKLKLSQGVSVEEVAQMSRQLATLLNARIPLIDSLAATLDQVENPIIRKALADIKEKVSEGSRLAEAMQPYPKVFDDIYRQMVRAGEESGALDVVLNRLADYKEAQADLKGKVKSALMYPVIMLIVAVAMLGFLFTQVVPQIAEVIEKQDLILPLPTRMVMGVTYIITNYWLVVLIFVGLAVLGFRYWKDTDSGRTKLDEFYLKMPVFGKLNMKIAVARFSRTLATLLNSGVQLLPGLGIVKEVMDNVVLSRVMERVMVSVKEGESLADPLKRSGMFPSMFLHMIAVGEKTGLLESMLEKVADTYDKEVDNYVGAMTSILTPVLLVVLGGIIAVVVFAVLLPILQLTQTQ